MKPINFIQLSAFSILILSCNSKPENSESALASEHLAELPATSKSTVIFDTDANNELDDQHALAYLLLNGESFIVKGITVNATFNGGDIDNHYKEAERVIRLCNLDGKIPLIKGANGSFPEIRSNVTNEEFDGSKAIDFIIETAKQVDAPLTIIAVGKLTNVALALEKDPSITSKLRIVWLGSNYPEPGEYNQVNDTSAMNYILNTRVSFEMVTVRYGKPSGTDAVKITQQEVDELMPGKGPMISEVVTGRHGGSFTTFGDYSMSLFEHTDYYGDPPSRALFDMAAVAIVKNPDWAEYSEIPGPILISENWVDKPDNDRKIGLWENFNKEEIMEDFYSTFDNYVLTGTK
jgi:inosine-uridine nucleoside N-ribohydrolase